MTKFSTVIPQKDNYNKNLTFRELLIGEVFYFANIPNAYFLKVSEDRTLGAIRLGGSNTDFGISAPGTFAGSPFHSKVVRVKEIIMEFIV